MANFLIACPLDIPHYSKFRQFSYLPFDINQFRCIHFSIFTSYLSDPCKLGSSIFERSLIFKFGMSAILKFRCLKYFFEK